MESTGLPGAIHASDPAHALLREYTGWEATGGVQVGQERSSAPWTVVPGCLSILINCTVGGEH